MQDSNFGKSTLGQHKLPLYEQKALVFSGCWCSGSELDDRLQQIYSTLVVLN